MAMIEPVTLGPMNAAPATRSGKKAARTSDQFAPAER